ncbi:hypothetical protein ACFC5Z_41770 [Streptomyces sp. NPDC056004]|uniref:hypothetical protein n=1 Tax=Streptomyces sp. NPDC056004 TaxID=3345677 RepID=UPI0035DDB780
MKEFARTLLRIRQNTRAGQTPEDFTPVDQDKADEQAGVVLRERAGPRLIASE